MLPTSRLRTVIDEVLARARSSGERSIGLARFVLISALLLRMLIVGPPLRAGHPRDWLLLGVAISMMAGTLLIDRRIRAARPSPRIVTISVLTDAIGVGIALTALVCWPYPGYLGLTRAPSFAFVIVALVGAALRFSLPLVLISIGVNAVTIVSLILYETLGSPARPFVLEELLTIGILFVSSATLAIALVLRGRKLILQGSQALHRAERTAETLGAYVSNEVAEQVLTDPELKLGGARQSVVCLFSDLRGYTSYAETLPPEQLVAEVNAYLEAMVNAIGEEGGVIDKFIGDAIMVVFGVPQPRPDDAVRAIRTARAMQRALAKHNLERRERDLPPLVQGIGVHAGSAVVGNIGTRERMQHTVMGSVVNVASRLESATKEVGVAVIISGATVEAARATGAELPELRPLPPMQVRGVRDPLPIYCFPDDGFSRPIMLPEASGQTRH